LALANLLVAAFFATAFLVGAGFFEAAFLAAFFFAGALATACWQPSFSRTSSQPPF